jgi:photosystem II stability/assembly factor-like uncharacterized protein
MKYLFLLAAGLLWLSPVQAQRRNTETTAKPTLEDASLSALAFRSIGPALTSGRIADLAVHPHDPHTYFLAVASGGVWRTTNAGTTFDPVFDREGAYSIGCVSISPSNPHTVWVGTGENNNQRSVAYGDGVYRSTDGGSTWKNMGLKNSEHIGMIAIHPRDEQTVYVAAYGPLWAPGADRGIYKTTNGGETWERILHVSENTGFNEVHFDPCDPNTLYAAAHQRRRHVFTYIDGGPESAIYKSTDAGKTWRKLEQGLPRGDKGRIALAVSPANPDVLYAMVAATEGGGTYRSTNRGESWTKQSDRQTAGNYYQELYPHPADVNKVYSMDTFLHHTEDGGITWKMTGEKSKHVDNHCMWINPRSHNHWLVGCDGGLYETFDAGSTWKYFTNLPITQFYRVAVDNSEPFYYVYGGTQDNNTQGGPSRTTSSNGITSEHWFITNGGDGFKPQIDPVNPNIVYGQAQYGWLVRYDRRSGEQVPIQPQPGRGEAAYRWNWDAPLLISPHKPERLYFAANVIFRSEDRGNSWTVISPDLTRQIDRNQLKVMGKVWSPEAVAKNQSTSIYGNIVAFDESPMAEGLLYAGTDDGLIQISENGGQSWTRMERFPGVPEGTYVNAIKASLHDANTVYAAFNNHKNGDFKPYILVSTNRGRSWSPIQGNLPERGSVYSLVQDHVEPGLLFAGTEFGVFYTTQGGQSWTQLKAGLPTIAVRDMEIQRRENDLVLATFGRGFYILDDYSPLRSLTREVADKPAHLFAVRDALRYMEESRIDMSGKGFMGEQYFTAPNPPYGATFTYHIGKEYSTAKQQRLKQTEALRKDGKDEIYPDVETLRLEDREEAPYLLAVVRNAGGRIVRKLRAPATKGLHRLSWNLRHAPTSPVKLQDRQPGLWESPDEGMPALPGRYTVELHEVVNGVPALLHEPVAFQVKALQLQSLPAINPAAVLSFQEGVAELQRQVKGVQRIHSENEDKLKHLLKAVENYPSAPLELMAELRKLQDDIYQVKIALYGDDTRSRLGYETLPGITSRLAIAEWSSWWNTSEPTKTVRDQAAIASELFEPVLNTTRRVAEDLSAIEKRLVELKVPYTPGRGKDWGQE